MRPVLNHEHFKDVRKTKVLIGTVVDKRCLSDVVSKLNRKFPMNPDLCFLKRINNADIILGEPAIRNSFINEFAEANLFENIREIEVASICPKSRVQYEQARKLWPCNPRFDRRYEQLLEDSNFNSDDLETLSNWMSVAIFVAKFARNINIGAIIVEPNTQTCIAIGLDNRLDNPCQHAVMVAIDNVAKNQGFSGAWQPENFENDSPTNMGLISKQFETQLIESFPKTNFNGLKLNERKRKFENSPYLCTNYDCYVTREPCLMCSMALVHSRIRRVFFGSVNHKDGALESHCNLHFVRELNHHFQVFGGLLQSQCDSLVYYNQL